MQIYIEPSLHDNLLNELLEVPILQTYEGRTSLLASISGHEHWKRVDDNNRADLVQIIAQLKGTFLGDTEEEETWAMSIFIKRACYSVERTTRSKKLEALRTQCVDCLKQAQQKQTPSMPSFECTAGNQILTLPTVADPPPPPDTSVPPASLPVNPSPSQETSPGLILLSGNVAAPLAHKIDTTSDSDFFDRVTSLIALAQERCSDAYAPLREQALEFVSPRQMRKAIEALEEAMRHLEEFSALLDKVVPLPEKVAPHHQHLVEHTRYLITQLGLLVGWLSSNSKIERTIREQFTKIESEMEVLAVLTDTKRAGRENGA